MSRVRKPTAAQLRERRARIAAIVLGAVFVLVCAVQAPKLLRQLHGSSTASAPLVAGAPIAVGAPIAAGAAPSTGTFVSATAPAAAHLGRLSRFALKDPFRQQLQAAAAGGAGGAAPPAKQPTKPAAPVKASVPPTQSKTFTPTPAKPTAPRVTRRGILLLLDGRRQGLLRGDLFPAANPIFRLVSFSATAARVALVGGTFGDGGTILSLRPGHRLILKNATTGARYVLVYVRVAQVVPSAAN
jgi:hypothetical protein